MNMAAARRCLRGLMSKSPYIQQNKYYNVFGIKDLVQREKPEKFTVHSILKDDQNEAVELIKTHYLKEHVLVRDRQIDLTGDQAVTEYLFSVLKQGSSMYVKTADGKTAGVCVNFAVSPVDPPNLRNFAYYRQDPNTRDFLNFIAKLQETPNLWNMYKKIKVFEIKMLTVVPEFRRQGLAQMLVEKSIILAKDLGYRVMRMDCINAYDYKIAESCNLNCLVRFPLHKLRGQTAPYIKRSSEYNRYVRVYVQVATTPDLPHVEMKEEDLLNMIE